VITAFYLRGADMMYVTITDVKTQVLNSGVFEMLEYDEIDKFVRYIWDEHYNNDGDLLHLLNMFRGV
jgi:hypothetical protein